MCTYRGQSYPVYESMKSVHVGADDKYCHLAITFFFFFLGGEMKILFGQMWMIRGRTSTDRIFFFFLRVNSLLETPVLRTDWRNYY